MPLSFEEYPTTCGLLYQMKMERRPGHRARIFQSPRKASPETLREVAAEIQAPEAAGQIDCEQIAILARLAGAAARESDGHDPLELTSRLREIAAARWSEVATPLARIALANLNYSSGSDLLDTLPDLAGSPEMIDALTEGLSGNMSCLHRIVDPDKLVIRSMDQARRALPASEPHRKDHITTYIVAALARGMGWTKWVKLFAILTDMPELAGDGEVAPPKKKDDHEPDAAVAGRKAAYDAICNDGPLRETAQLILDLDGALAYAAPDLRSAYVNRLSRAIGSDSELRCAAVEALLSRPQDRQRDLGLYAACILVAPEDEAFLDALIRHPDRRVGYDAQMIHEGVFGSAEDRSKWPRPSMGGIAEGLFRIRLASPPAEQARTWLGDRLLERMIEHSASSEEERFARAFEHYSEEGEESLLKSFFGDLSTQFAHLDQSLLAAARATRSGRRTRISLHYRTVDKAEEGKAGVNLDPDEPPPSFSADLCLIVDPYLDGKALGRRATLVQAKRLRRIEPAKPERGLAAVYELKPKQMSDLLRQTGSSFYMFQGPGDEGRGLPMIPTQLVSDLAYHRSATATRLDRMTVGLASRTFADWLTYDVVALRTGDPYEALLAKADGGIGRRPRELGMFGTVEIQIRVGDLPKEGEERLL